MSDDVLISTARPPLLWHYTRTVWDRFFGLNVSQVDSLLFVGGQFRPEQWSGLHSLGIRAVLSLQAEYEDRFIGDTPPERVLRLSVIDHNAPTLDQLVEAIVFIDAANQDNLPVLVHCHAGIGRAPTTAAAYLMAGRGRDRSVALSDIQQARPIIALNDIQRQRLHEWEHYLTEQHPLKVRCARTSFV